MTETTKSPSQLIDDRIAALGDWRGEMLAHLRSIILATDSDIVEEWKWRGVPVWYRDGMICTGETYKTHVKMTFAKRSEEHTSELQSLIRISYAVFCLIKKKYLMTN